MELGSGPRHSHLAGWTEWEDEGDLSPSPHPTFSLQAKVNTLAKAQKGQVAQPFGSYREILRQLGSGDRHVPSPVLGFIRPRRTGDLELCQLDFRRGF